MDKKIAVKIAEAKVRVAQRRLVEAKKALKESEVAMEPLTKEILTTAINFTKGYITGDVSLGSELKETLRQHIEGCMFEDDDDEEASVAEAERILAMKPTEVEALAKIADPAGYAELETEYNALFESAEKTSGRALNEDVNNYTFKDLFGKDFDEVLKIAVEKIAKIPEEHEELGFESVEDFLNSGSDSDLFDALEEDAGDETDRIAVSVIVALFDKKINLEQYNDLREKLGLDPIEVEKKESVASKKKNESEETISPAEVKVLKKAIRNTIGHAHYYKEVGQELQDTIDQLLEADAFDTEEEIEAAEKLSKAHYGSVAIKACHVDLKGVSAIKAEL